MDEAAFRVRRGTDTLDLEPKAPEVLLVLLARRGQLVTKAELQAAVWANTAVTESALTRVIAQVRKALDDDARDARYIETVPTRGYRFVAPVVVGGPQDDAPAAGAPAVPAPEPPPARGWSRTAMAVTAGFALAAVLAALTWRRAPATSRSEAPGSGAPVLLSTAPGLNAYPSFAPDGASLVFGSDRSGAFELYVRALDPAARERPLTADGQQNIQPAWSPDGRSIAYVSMGRGGIWSVPVTGGAPRPVSPFGARPSWSPDSRTIVFQSQAPAHALLYSGGSGSVLWTVDAAGGAPRLLTHRSGWGHGSPVYAPDGSRIAYASGRSVWTIRPDGTDARVLRAFDSANVDGLFYARDGTALYAAFAPSATDDPAGRLVRLPLASPGAAAGRAELVQGTLGTGRGQFALAPDGRRVAYIEGSARHSLESVPLRADGSAAGPPRTLLAQLDLRAASPVLSPDGARVAFTAFRPGGGWGLWIAWIDSGQAEPARAAPIARSALSWLADGRIVASEPASDGGTRLIAFDPASGREEALLEVPYAMPYARASADGSRVAFMRAETPEDVFQVWIAHLPGGTPRRVTSDPEGMGWPVWAPGNRELLVEALRRGDSVLGLMPAEGGAFRVLADRPSHNWPGEVSADGSRLVFAAQRGGVWNVCVVEVASRRETCVTPYTRVDGYVRTPAFSPRGDRVVYEYGILTARLWVSELPGPDRD